MNAWMWAVVTVSVATALSIAHWRVPKLRRPHVEEGDTPPDFTGLASPLGMLTVMFLAMAGSSVFAIVSPAQWGLWFPYVAIGAPLIHVDLRTTYLPNQLMMPFLATMGLGLLPTFLSSWEIAVAACVGALGGYLIFWLVWRSGAGLGFGDVRLAAAVGAVAGTFGLTGWVWAILLSTIVGAVIAVAMAMARQRIFAYGPALWVGPLIAAWAPLS